MHKSIRVEPVQFAAGPAPNLSASLSCWQALAEAGRALVRAAERLGAEPAALAPSPAHGPAAGHSLVQTANDLLVAKARAERRPRYLTQLRSTLKAFLAGRADRDIASVTPAEIEGWLSAHGWAPKTRLGYLTDLKTLFNFAVRRGYLPRAPTDAIDRPLITSQPPGILTPAQAAELMRTCRATDAGLVPFVAICLFAGVRPAETSKLAWAGVSAGYVEVTAHASKTRRRRLVPIQPNLAAWLALGGDLPVVNLDKRMKALRRAMPWPWPHDCLRHSFVSYALPLHGAATVALWAGHSETVLFAHYRELVTREAAAAFWAVG